MAERPRPRHGTIAGHEAHRRAGEKPCDGCRVAWNEYQRAWSATATGQQINRRNASIHARAKTILKRRHPEEFATIVAKLRAAALRDSAPTERAT